MRCINRCTISFGRSVRGWKSDIAEEDWNGIVRPLEGQAYSYMEKALGDILEIMEGDRGGRAVHHARLKGAALLVRKVR